MSNKAVITIRNEDTYKKLKVIANIMNISVGEVISKSIESSDMFDIAVEQMYLYILEAETKKQTSSKK